MLRHLSSRPLLLVDDHAHPQGDTTSLVGKPGPLGRERIVSALKLNNNPPMQLAAPDALADAHDYLLFDPTDASVVGVKGIWIHRLLKATRTKDTRRL